MSYMISEKDQLLEKLRYLIANDSGWLTPDDKHCIEAKIDELDSLISQRYNSHGY